MRQKLLSAAHHRRKPVLTHPAGGSIADGGHQEREAGEAGEVQAVVAALERAGRLPNQDRAELGCCA